MKRSNESQQKPSQNSSTENGLIILAPLLIGGSFLLIKGLIDYRQNKKLAAQIERSLSNFDKLRQQLKQEQIQQYQEQQKHLVNLNSLTTNPQIQAFFTDLLTNYTQNNTLSKREIFQLIKKDWKEWEKRWREI